MCLTNRNAFGYIHKGVNTSIQKFLSRCQLLAKLNQMSVKNGRGNTFGGFLNIYRLNQLNLCRKSNINLIISEISRTSAYEDVQFGNENANNINAEIER